MAGLHLEVDTRDMVSLNALAKAYGQRGLIAAERALKKTLKRTETLGIRALAKHENLPSSVLRRHRVFRSKKIRGAGTIRSIKSAPLSFSSSVKGNGLSGDVWFGLRDIPVRYLLSDSTRARFLERPPKRGLRIRKRHYPHAFAALGQNANFGIFEREGASRLPLRQVTTQFSRGATAALRSIMPEVRPIFRRTLVQELNYAVNVKR